MSGVAILGSDGRPLPPAAPKVSPNPRRAQALNGGQGFYNGPPYDAADLYGQHMAAWTPALWSPDGELNPYRDRIVSRVRDMVRNDGWASGAVTRIVDNAVGPNLRPLSKPDYRFLAHYTSNGAFDATWAKEFGRAVDANWRTWANDEQLYCDAARNQTFGQLMRTAFRHKIVDGDALAIMLWLPRRIGKGRARYATAVQLVDPDRLSNPQQLFDSATMRGGVEIEEETGAAVAYHIRKAHAGDWFSAAKSLTWERVPRETTWGRHIVVHDFDGDRATQHRGGTGVFAPVLQRLKMLVKYDGVELDASIPERLAPGRGRGGCGRHAAPQGSAGLSGQRRRGPAGEHPVRLDQRRRLSGGRRRRLRPRDAGRGDGQQRLPRRARDDWVR